MNSKRKHPALPPFLETADGSYVAGLDQANKLQDYFCGNFPVNTTLPEVDIVVPDLICDVQICRDSLLHDMLSLNTSKANSPDAIPAIVLKNCAHVLVQLLARLFQMSLSDGFLPTSWKSGYVFPIFNHTGPLHYYLSFPSYWRNKYIDWFITIPVMLFMLSNMHLCLKSQLKLTFWPWLHIWQMLLRQKKTGWCNIFRRPKSFW